MLSDSEHSSGSALNGLSRSLSFLLIALFLSVFYSGFCFAERYHFDSYSVSEGLPQSNVTDILQDGDGFMWFSMATGGAARFDGYEFRAFTVKDGIPDITINVLHKHSDGRIIAAGMGGAACFDGDKFTCPPPLEELRGDTVFSMMTDGENNLWFGTLRGAVKYDGENLTRYTEKDGLSRYQVLSMIEDEDGGIWMGTNHGLNRFDGETFKSYYVEDGLPGSTVNTLARNPSGGIWIGTESGICLFDGGRFIEPEKRYPAYVPQVLDIFVEEDGSLWIGTARQGVLRREKGSFRHMRVENGLESNQIRVLYRDRWGNMWLGTGDRGVMVYSGSRFTVLDRNDGLVRNQITEVHADSMGNLWFGSAGGGLSRWDGERFSHYFMIDGLPSMYISMIIEDSGGGIWIGTSDGVARYRNGRIRDYSGLLGNIYVTALYEDRSGNIWVGSIETGLKKYDGEKVFHYTRENGLSDSRIHAIYQDGAGTVWLGTHGKLIAYRDGSFEDYRIPGGPVNDYAFDMVEDDCGNIWAATRGGLVVFDPRGPNDPSSWQRPGRDVPVRDQSLSLLIKDREGRIWSANNNGLDRIELDGSCRVKSVKYYGHDEGFVEVESYPHAAAIDGEGNLWFGTGEGAVKYDSREDDINEDGPSVNIRGLRIFFQTVDLEPYKKSVRRGVKLTFPHDRNHITFDFVGISFPAPENTLYSYRLDGLDSEWSPPTKERSAYYPALPPGDYTFRVKARNNDGVWTEKPAEYRFGILPPFWMTPWFLALCILALLGGLLGYIRFRTTNLARQRDRLQKKVDRRTAELRRARDELEVKVSDRTAELRKYSDELIRHREQLRSLASELSLAEEKERRRIAEGLHDGVSQNLAVANMRLKSFQRVLSEEDREEFAEILQIIDLTLGSTRDLTFDLSPPVLYELGIIATIEWLVEQMNEKHDMTFSFSPCDEPGELDIESRIALFKAVRELLMNAVKHSEAKEVKVDLTLRDGELVVKVRDDGIGFDPGVVRIRERKSFGLFNIRERMDHRGWEFYIESSPGSGTAARIVVKPDGESN